MTWWFTVHILSNRTLNYRKSVTSVKTKCAFWLFFSEVFISCTFPTCILLIGNLRKKWCSMWWSFFPLWNRSFRFVKFHPEVNHSTNRLCSFLIYLSQMKQPLPVANLELHEAWNEVGFYFELLVLAWWEQVGERAYNPCTHARLPVSGQLEGTGKVWGPTVTDEESGSFKLSRSGAERRE